MTTAATAGWRENYIVEIGEHVSRTESVLSRCLAIVNVTKFYKNLIPDDSGKYSRNETFASKEKTLHRKSNYFVYFK